MSLLKKLLKCWCSGVLVDDFTSSLLTEAHKSWARQQEYCAISFCLATGTSQSTELDTIVHYNYSQI